MITFKEFLSKKLNKTGKVTDVVCPQTRDELKQIIDKTIKEKGPKCDLNFIDTSKIKDMHSLFFMSDFNGNISKWDVSNVTDMSDMFYKSKFNGDISKWVVDNVESMENMFAFSEFNGNISKWNTVKAKWMARMFYKSKFNRDISDWYVENVRDTTAMFAYSPFNHDLSKWRLYRVGKNVWGMFYASPIKFASDNFEKAPEDILERAWNAYEDGGPL